MNQTTDTTRLIMDAIVDLLVSDAYPLHSKLPSERDLAASLQVSRASIREAMSALALLGLVETRHGGGNYVGDMQMGGFIQALAKLIEKNTKAEDLWEVRRMLEVEAIHLITRNVNENTPQQEALEQSFATILAGMKEALELNDAEMGIRYDTTFHATLFAFSGNTILALIANGIQEILRNLVAYNRNIILRSQENGQVLFQQHQALMQAILAKDEQTAVSLLTSHLDFVFKMDEGRT